MLHSAAALLKIAEMEYSGTNSFFIRVLLDKKYALPYRVLDALVEHFLRFQRDSRAMPVVWHQALLCFVQRYKREITAADKQRLKQLCGAQRHYLVTPELLRELQDGVSRCAHSPVMPDCVCASAC
jgi:essential nuclear protein 1